MTCIRTRFISSHIFYMFSVNMCCTCVCRARPCIAGRTPSKDTCHDVTPWANPTVRSASYRLCNYSSTLLVAEHQCT